MPYVTDVANSLADLLTAIRNACTANGWTLSGNVLHKGTCYASITHNLKGAHVDQGFLEVIAGNGIDGSNNLTDPATNGGDVRYGRGCLGPMGDGTGILVYTDWDWPVEYHIHILTDPDEVYVLVNYFSNQYWQHLAFGQSPVQGCPGTGNWHSATCSKQNLDTGTLGRMPPSARICTNPQGGVFSSFNSAKSFGGPFWWESKDESTAVPIASQFHGAFDLAGNAVWSNHRYIMGSDSTTAGRENGVSASKASQPLPQYSPNTWNNEAHLIRYQIMQFRPEFKSSVLGELKHLRFIRNDFIDDGTVIAIGPDKWKVYPMYRKDAAIRNGPGNAGGNHSGTCAIAVRYDGV